MEVRGQLYAPAVLLPVEEPWGTLYKWLGGPSGEEKNLLLPLGFELPTARAVTWLLYRATPAICRPLNTVDIRLLIFQSRSGCRKDSAVVHPCTASGMADPVALCVCSVHIVMLYTG